MKREEIQSLIEGISKEQLDAIMRMNGEDINQAKAPIASLQEQLTAAKSQIETFQQQQKEQLSQEEQLNVLRQSLEQTQKDLVLKANRIDARSILKDIGLDDDAVEKQLDLIVVENQAQTTANANALVDLIKAQRDATKAATEQAMLQAQLPPAGSAGSTAVTKDDFDKMSYSDKASFLKDNPDFLSSLK